MVIWIILFVISIAVFFILSYFLLPKLFLSPSYGNKLIDVGLKKVDEKHGISIVYRVENQAKEYVDQYILSNRNGKNILMCRFTKEIKNIDYDVIVYNHRNNIVAVLNVYEDVNGNDYSKHVELPIETSHVCLLLNSVNNKNLNKLELRYVSKSKTVIYLALVSCLLVGVLFISRYCISRVIGDVFYESFITSQSGVVSLILLSIVLIGINLLYIVFKVLRKR